MLSTRTDLSIVIEFTDSNFAKVILKSLEPENSQIDINSSIEMKFNSQKLTIKYFSTSSLATVRNTIDDILNTINTSERVYKTIKNTGNL